MALRSFGEQQGYKQSCRKLGTAAIPWLAIRPWASNLQTITRYKPSYPMATNNRESSLTMRPERRAPRYPFAATAEATDSSDVRPASVKDLSVFGAYLAMPDPFSNGAVIIVKIRTQTEFFQCKATVAHSTDGLGMGIEFSNMNPAFRTVLQEWLLRLSMSAPQESP